NRIRSNCKECGGSSICIHDRIRSKCKECSDATKLTINNMIRHSKESDIKRGYYNADTHIDYCFIKSLMEESMLCHYCKIEMQCIEYNNSLCTIERLNNTMAHSKSNCVLACRT